MLCLYEGFECVLFDEDIGDGREGCGEGEWKEGWRVLVLDGLRTLCAPELKRAGRLRRDLSRLRVGCSSDDTGPKLKAFTQHITSITSRKPHLLLAYTWLLYMALFSGGRYIRARLRGAGREFWTMSNEKEKEKAEDIDIDGALSFWTFEGREDGEDVKAEFKQRFAEMEGWLTSEERDEVVQEAVYIMDAMMGVVEEIAETIGKEDPCPKAAGRHGGVDMDEPNVRWLCLKHILPMGMFELITGASKAVMMGFEPLYGKT